MAQKGWIEEGACPPPSRPRARESAPCGAAQHNPRSRQYQTSARRLVERAGRGSDGRSWPAGIGQSIAVAMVSAYCYSRTRHLDIVQKASFPIHPTTRPYARRQGLDASGWSLGVPSAGQVFRPWMSSEFGKVLETARVLCQVEDRSRARPIFSDFQHRANGSWLEIPH